MILGCSYLLFVVLPALFLFWLSSRLFLLGPDLSRFDDPAAARATERTEASPETEEVHALLREFRSRAGSSWSVNRLKRVRELMDSGFGVERSAQELGVEIVPTEEPGMPAEWILAPDCDPQRRLLYVHGGAFYAGSPRSHRPLTAGLARRTKAAVLAIDYRLMPEHSRRAGIADCQAAYRFVLEHGPAGPTSLRTLFLAGDSAGGNLALMLIAWARDNGLRAVDGVAALSPSTDSTLSSPTYKENVDTDVMLGPLFRPLLWVPKTLLLLGGMLVVRIHPRNPIVSPLLGSLADLPPTLVQASESEMLLGDARRYVHKAQSEGSPATLQTWPGQVHVWQIFDQILPEAREALAEIETFFERCAG